MQEAIIVGLHVAVGIAFVFVAAVVCLVAAWALAVDRPQADTWRTRAQGVGCVAPACRLDVNQ